MEKVYPQQRIGAHESPGERAASLTSPLEDLGLAVERTQTYLLERQSEDGYWVGDLEADASVSAGYISIIYYMTGKIDPIKAEKMVTAVTRLQNSDGSWSAYYGGPGDLSVCIQVYLGLKLAGVTHQSASMRRAQEYILRKGGIGKANVITKIWLALFGQFDWRDTPSVPPEIIYFPHGSPFNIYDCASWSRQTILALSIVTTRQPTCQMPPNFTLDELYLEPPEERRYPIGKANRPFSWKNFFLQIDRLLKLWARLPLQPGRGRALRKVEQWIIDRQEADGSWGGIMLPWIYSLAALKSLGYPLHHPVIHLGLKGIDDFLVETEHTLLLQPAESPVWDSAWTTIALAESGLAPDHPALRRAARWLLSKEIRHPGDWRVNNPKTTPGGWAFEFENNNYPDMDDSAVAPRALRRVKLSGSGEREKGAAIQRALDWVLAMQSIDGGWAAFDRDNTKQFLAEVPFADFISPLDPTCSDVTAHVIELISEMDCCQQERQRAVAYLQATQEADGAWYGRWGVNYIYGTGLALEGLAAAGETADQPYIRRAIDWLLSTQNQDGGWGETCETYADPQLRGRGTSTASQTAWSLIGLMPFLEKSHPAVQRGIAYLLESQQADGSWIEPQFTGAGFPKVFYLRYDMYRIYFPLLALARFMNAD